MSPGAQLTAIALITGDHTVLADQARQHLFDIRYYQARASNDAPQVLVVVDGDEWDAEFSEEDRSSPFYRWLKLPIPCGLPGRLVNIGVHESQSQTTHVALLPIGAEISAWYANFRALLAAAVESNAPLVVGHRGAGETRHSTLESHLTHPHDGFSSRVQLAWLQMLDLVPCANAVFRRDWFRANGGFTSLPELQRCFWWEFTLRVARVAPTPTIALQPVNALSWHRYPFSQELALPVDAAARLMMRALGEPCRGRPTDTNDCITRPTNLLDTASQRVRDLCRLLASRDNANRSPLRVTVLGDIDSAAHSQLGFYGFFELLRHEGIVSWRGQLDGVCQPIDLIDADLVIFVRTSSENGLSLLRWCRRQAIPTVYAIDDNWFWQGRDWQDFADVFAPGKPKYDRFIEAIGLADAVFAYNDVLLADLEQHVSQTVRLPTSIDLDVFPRIDPPTGRTVVGFVGSERRETAPLEALARVAAARGDVEVFVMSHAVPAALQSLPAEKLRFAPYQYNYGAYAATVCAAAPAILLAPAGHTRFEASKCPNKYLEITAVGAAGIYSCVDPYRDEVIDGETGLLVGDGLDDWVDALNRLLDNPIDRIRLASNAMQDVTARFSTTRVLPRFLDAILSVSAIQRAFAPKPLRVGVVVDANSAAWVTAALPSLTQFDPVAVQFVFIEVSGTTTQSAPAFAPIADHPFAALTFSNADLAEARWVDELIARSTLSALLAPPTIDLSIAALFANARLEVQQVQRIAADAQMRLSLATLLAPLLARRFASPTDIDTHINDTLEHA